MKVLVTGAAGFIGSDLSQRLLERGDEVIGIDNHNDYYSPVLKEARLARQVSHPNYTHERVDLADRQGLGKLFKAHMPQHVVNLAAQAGVRYSLENPLSYIDSNIVGFAHILEECRHHGVEHLVYASSSSVYGANTSTPFSVHDNVDHPLSLYAATKKSNELMAHSYNHLYNLPTTGLRFFTVYGPWDRPDMALQKFAQAITKGEPIQVYNHGNQFPGFHLHRRYRRRCDPCTRPASTIEPDWSSDNPDPGTSKAPWRIYNIGNNRPVKLMDYIGALENALGKDADIEFLPLQPGDMANTWAHVDDLAHQFEYQLTTSVEDGINNFALWFKAYY